MEAQCEEEQPIDRETDDREDDDGEFDWSAFFDLAVLCPTPACCAGDGDLDRIYHQCSQGYSVVGHVFI